MPDVISVGVGIAALLVLWVGYRDSEALRVPDVMLKLGASAFLLVLVFALFLAIITVYRHGWGTIYGPTLVTVFGVGVAGADLVLDPDKHLPAPLIVAGLVLVTIIAGIGRLRHDDDTKDLIDHAGTVLSLVLGLGYTYMGVREAGPNMWAIVFPLWASLGTLAFVPYLFVSRLGRRRRYAR